MHDAAVRDRARHSLDLGSRLATTAPAPAH
jgi:hypothetical protein